MRQLQALATPPLKEIKGVIIAAATITGVSKPDRPTITITVSFDTNYTEVRSAKEGQAEVSQTWYARESWRFSRKRDVLSRPPERITAIHCPKCGGPLERKADGTCSHCGVKIVGGDFDWFVTSLDILEREARGPLLTEDVPEEGTDLPTVYQPDFDAVRRRFMGQTPDFSWRDLEARFRHVFMELQQAWSTLQWDRARPYETDRVFETHLFWITEYQRQCLRNVLDDVQIKQVIPVKVLMDPFYDGITLRIFASMCDYTVNAQGEVLCGSRNVPRSFSEYWTFIRRRGVRASGMTDRQCPNCGAPLKVNMAGVCEYCQGKITSGEFDWVLSLIEQDEAYRG